MYFTKKNIFKKFPLNLRMKFCDDCSIYVSRLMYFKFCNFLHNLRFCASIHKFCNLLHNLWICASILYILQFRCRIFKILQNCLPRGAILQYSPYWKLSARCRIHGWPSKRIILSPFTKEFRGEGHSYESLIFSEAQIGAVSTKTSQ